MDVSRAITEGYKIWIAGGAVLLALLWPRIPLAHARRFLVLLALVATVNYARWGASLFFSENVDGYDVIHYYLNAKYFDELGYYDLYPACILADHENQGPRYDEGRQYLAQDETGHFRAPISHALERGEVVKDSEFTPARWAEFNHDFLYLQREVAGWNGKLWRQMILDHGFNGTPAWVLLAHPITELWPVEWVKLLAWADALLLIGALGLVSWAFGGVPALWTGIFLMVTYSTRWPTITWVLFRYDWVAALLVAMVALHRRWPWLAGLAAGYSAAMRMFPALWMWGPFSQGVAGLAKRTVDRSLLRLAGGFLLGVALLYGGSAVVYGLKPAQIHFANMSDHNSAEQLSSRRIGMALGLAYDGNFSEKNISKVQKARVHQQKPMRYALGLSLMGILGYAVRRKSQAEAFAFGFLPFFFLTTASYYYFVARITLALLHGSQLDRPRHRVGLAMIFGLEAWTNGLQTLLPDVRVPLIGTLAWGILLYAVVQIVWMIWEDRHPTPEKTQEIA